ncbi:hypothetical protein E4U09_004582 [Claviceps aff. purpurea]|uniref:Purine transporter azgA n=1 Tax=Claviceps aff. purpurea TaxID=1967640 RepID=A0A9P7QEX3_9HYPO|nr:hypothetical protein E4U09_004582 [Claviceps aff. purpurea]
MTTPSKQGRPNVLVEMRKFFGSINGWVARSRAGSYFRLSGSDHVRGPACLENATFCREIRAGLTTFATMAYIISVNASLLSQTGGPCVCNLPVKAECDTIPEFSACKEVVRRDLITATAAISGMASLVFGLATNLPVALAPGMGLNAYFAFQVVGVNGSGNTKYSTALTAVFLEGIIFIVLALTGMRQWLVKVIPSTLKTATGVGIGLFLTELGLSYSVGIGAITGGGLATPLALGGCPAELLSKTTGACEVGQMTNPKARNIGRFHGIWTLLSYTSADQIPQLWLAVFCGGIVTAFLMAYRVKYAFIVGIALVSVISWPRGTSVTYFPDTEAGNSRFEFFKQIVTWHPIHRTLNQIDWTFDNTGSHFVLAIFTFLYVDIIDATATLYSMVRFCGVVDQKDGDFPRSTLAYCTDAFFISVGALFGCSPVTAFIESGAGIAEGGRTGITAMVTGLCFLVSIFFAPIFASLPPWATGCTLVMVRHADSPDRLVFWKTINLTDLNGHQKVGCMMIRQITQVNWHYVGDALPSFVVMAFIPFSYSVAYGLIAGILVYTVLNGLVGILVYVSGGRFEPREYDLKEYWTWKGTGRRPWFVRAIRAKRSDRHVDHVAEDSDDRGNANDSILMTRVKTISNDYSTTSQ